MKKEKNRKQKRKMTGFSLVEMILVVAISSIIALAVSQIFLTSMKTFERNKEMQKNLEEARSSMEMMAKNIRMSKYAKNVPSGGVDSLYMYNFSQDKCIRYQINNTIKVLNYSSCSPNKDAEGKLVGADSNPPDVCYSSPCVGGAAYPAPAELTTRGNITGDFYMPFETNRTTLPYSIGRATIRITTEGGTDAEKTLQTSVSFRDYEDILQ